MLTIKLAFRSILKHKNKFIAIGILIIGGTLLIVLGQVIVDTVYIYSKKSIVNNLTGNFIIYSAKSKDKASPFSFQAPLQPIYNLRDVYKFLNSCDEIKEYVPLAQNMGSIKLPDGKEMPIIFNAIDPDKYKRVFNNFEIIEGSYFSNKDKGILLSEENFNRYKKTSDLRIGDTVTIIGFTGNGSINAIKTKVIGVFKASKYGSVFKFINFIDIETYRKLYNFEGVESQALSTLKNIGENLESDEDIFATDFEKDININTIKNAKIVQSSGYTMILILLKDDKLELEFLNKFNKVKDKLGLKISNWYEASSGLAQLSKMLQIFIMIVTIIIFITVGIIIMNTLIINILERISEIGTMRAIGAKKNFIRKMFIFESLILGLISGLIGIIISIIIIWLTSLTGINIKGTFAILLYGGGKVYPIFKIGVIFKALIIILVVAIISTLYPLRLATKVTPLVAMQDK